MDDPRIGAVIADHIIEARPFNSVEDLRGVSGITNDEAARREGIKLTWDYLQKQDIGKLANNQVIGLQKYISAAQ